MRMESEIKDKIIKLEEDALVKAALGMKLQNFHNSTLYYYIQQIIRFHFQKA